MRFALLSIFALSLASLVGCAASAEEASVDEGNLTIAAPQAGKFTLHKEANHTADPECDSFVNLELVGDQAKLSDSLTGRCALVALFDPNPRAFTLRQTGTSCGSQTWEGSRRFAIDPATTGIATIKIVDHRTRTCKDIVPAQLIVTEQDTTLFSQRSAPEGPSSSPPAPGFCANGTVKSEPNYIASADGMQCKLPRLHCVTKDSSSCPQLSPPSPDFCANGRRVAGPKSYISSADGMECEMPSLHCLTNDNSACPQLSPPSPDFCKDGTIESTPNFIRSADGMECSIPRLHCVTKDNSSCPQL